MPRFGHLDIGEGIGDAKAYNPMPIVQQYAQNLAIAKQKHEAEVKDLGDALAKSYDPNGLRNDADRKQLLSMYGDVKQKAIDAENIKDPQKKSLALSEVRQKMLELTNFTQGSKQWGQTERQLQLQHLKNPYSLDDESFNKLKAGADKVWNDPSVERDINKYQRGVDPEKVIKEYQEHKKEIKKEHPSTFDNGKIVGKDPFGRQLAVQTRIIPLHGDNGAFESTLAWANQNKDAYKTINDSYSDPQKYPDLQDPNPKIAFGKKLQQFMANQGDGNGFVETKEITGQYPERRLPPQPSWLEGYYIKKFGVPYDPNQRLGNNIETELIQDMKIPYHTYHENGDKSEGFDLSVKNFVPISDANKTFAGNADIDMQKGGIVSKDKSAITGTIAGIADVPVATKDMVSDKVNIKKGTPVNESITNNREYKRMILITNKNKDGETEQYLVDYNKLPVNIKNSKIIKESLSKLEKTPIYNQNNLSEAEFNKRWATLKKGERITGLDGNEYIKK